MWHDLAVSMAINASVVKALVTGAGLMVGLFGITWWLSRTWNNYSFVDIAWAYGLAMLAPWYAALLYGYPPRQVLVLAMAGAWSLRLGTYLLLRIMRHHPDEDVRYQVLRKKWQGHLDRRFFFFFQAQGLLVLLLSVPVLLALRNPAPVIAWVEWLGALVWLAGFVGESIADSQMRAFKRNAANKGQVCQVGLWRWSRHPNYFFESLIWWGLWLFACGSAWGWITVYAPLLILFFLLRVTGIPLTEKCAVESKGDAYRRYQRTTSPFVPWPPKDATQLNTPDPPSP